MKLSTHKSTSQTNGQNPLQYMTIPKDNQKQLDLASQSLSQQIQTW